LCLAGVLPVLAAASKHISSLLKDQLQSFSVPAAANSNYQLDCMAALAKFGSCLLTLFTAMASVWPQHEVIMGSAFKDTLLVMPELAAAVLQAAAAASAAAAAAVPAAASRASNEAATAAADAVQRLLLYCSWCSAALRKAGEVHGLIHGGTAEIRAERDSASEALLQVILSQDVLLLLAVDLGVKTRLLHSKLQGTPASAAAAGSSRASSRTGSMQQEGSVPPYHLQLLQALGLPVDVRAYGEPTQPRQS
jgi:hypothetical protein